MPLQPIRGRELMRRRLQSSGGLARPGLRSDELLTSLNTGSYALMSGKRQAARIIPACWRGGSSCMPLTSGPRLRPCRPHAAPWPGWEA